MAILPNPDHTDSDLLVVVHRGVDDAGQVTWDVTLDGPEGIREVLHTTNDETEAARLAVAERTNREKTARQLNQLRWLVSWDNNKHAFTREQPAVEVAVRALCGHLSRVSTVHVGEANLCFGCLVALGESLPDATWR